MDHGHRQDSCDVVVIGAGIAGLLAATTLKDSADVIVLEASGRAGGRVESVRRGDYWINVGAQFAEGSGALFEAMDRFDIPRASLAGKHAALSINHRTSPIDNPLSLMLRSRLSLRARLDLAAFGMRMRHGYRRLATSGDVDAARAYRAELDSADGSTLARGIRTPEVMTLFRDLAGQWLGCEPEETAATQLLISIGIAMEKAAMLPNYSLPVGGNQALVDAIATDLGARLHLRAPVDSVAWTQDGVQVSYRDEAGHATLLANKAVIAVPADCAATLIADLPPAHRDALRAVRYGRYALVGFFTNESGMQPWDRYFGISTPELAFQAVFNHAAALRTGPERRAGGALVCFSGGGRADRHLGVSDSELVALYRRDLVKLLPSLAGSLDEAAEVRRHARVVPFWAPGDRGSVRVLRRPLGPIHFSGDYLSGMPSMADAAESGARAARAILGEAI